jgi:molecular chaperone GrpE
MKTLEKAGLEAVEALGKPFDPNFHEAVSQQKDDTVAPGHVMIELQKGYVLNGRLIRPSTVVISSGKDANEEKFA